MENIREFINKIRTMKINEQVEYDAEQVKDLIIEKAQKTYDTLYKPILIDAMKKLNIVRIRTINGMTFFYFADGSEVADYRMEDNEEYNSFYDTYIVPWMEKPFYNIIDIDVKL